MEIQNGQIGQGGTLRWKLTLTLEGWIKMGKWNSILPVALVILNHWTLLLAQLVFEILREVGNILETYIFDQTPVLSLPTAFLSAKFYLLLIPWKSLVSQRWKVTPNAPYRSGIIAPNFKSISIAASTAGRAQNFGPRNFGITAYPYPFPAGVPQWQIIPTVPASAWIHEIF